MYKQYDLIKTKTALAAEDGILPAGSTGTIVEIYRSKSGVGYECEFVRSDGSHEALLTLNDSQIEIIDGNKSVNSAI